MAVVYIVTNSNVQLQLQAYDRVSVQPSEPTSLTRAEIRPNVMSAEVKDGGLCRREEEWCRQSEETTSQQETSQTPLLWRRTEDCVQRKREEKEYSKNNWRRSSGKKRV